MRTAPRVADAGLESNLKRLIRPVPDFPKPGILFRDVTPLLADAAALASVTDALAAPYRQAGITHVAGVESRGFILAAPVAVALGAGFVPIRKAGRLPAPTHAAEYALEYGLDRLEVHQDACGPASRVLLVDDVLATGGTAAAAMRVIEATGATVAGLGFLIELQALGGRAKLDGRSAVETLVVY